MAVIYAAQIIDDNATYAALCEGLSVATQNNELYLWSENRTTDIQAVKLEVGSVSTLALDLMQPADYASELRKCQRYLQIYNVPLWFYTPYEWYAETIFDLQEEMRIIPSFSYEGNIEITRDNGDLDISASDIIQFSGNTTKPLLRLQINSGKGVIGHSYLLRELKLIFSAEL